MGWLKKVGQIALKIGQVAGVVGPLAGQYLPKAGPIVTQALDITAGITAAIVQAEITMQDKTGPDRLKAILPFISFMVKQSNLLDGKKIKDEVLFNKGCGEMTQGMVDILNSLEAPVA